MLRGQVHSVGNVLHGRQFEEQTQIHHRQDQQAASVRMELLQFNIQLNQ